MSVPSVPDVPNLAPAAMPRWVVCLCAEWCGTCRDYRPIFNGAMAAHPNTQVLWLDMEDDAALVDDLDIETFPTILVGEGERLLFAGAVLPQATALSRLLTALDRQQTIKGDPALHALVAALQSRIRSV
jgi:thioredoxin 1